MSSTANVDADGQVRPSDTGSRNRRRRRRRRRRAYQTTMVGLVSEWLNHGWHRPLKRVLPQKQRFLYAFAGSLVWLAYRMDLDSVNVIATILAGLPTAAWLLPPLYLLIAAGFAWLISYTDRRSSPSRFFIEGLAFPLLVGTLLRAESPF